MSHVHFVSTESYKKRVIQLGEDPKHVHNVGALGIEHIYKLELLSREALEESIGLKLGKRNLLVTHHPETLDAQSPGAQFKKLLNALNEFPDCTIVFTKPNADTGGRETMKMIDEYVAGHANAVAFTSLGQQRYLSLMKLVDGVIGNSSSGIIEAPSFKTGTVNIGERQKGRIRSRSVIDCPAEKDAIVSAIKKIFEPGFRKELEKVSNPYDRCRHQGKSWRP